MSACLTTSWGLKGYKLIIIGRDRVSRKYDPLYGQASIFFYEISGFFFFFFYFILKQVDICTQKRPNIWTRFYFLYWPKSAAGLRLLQITTIQVSFTNFQLQSNKLFLYAIFIHLNN